MGNDELKLMRSNCRKIQPKLRMIANGSTVVNIMRAEQESAITIKSGRLLRTVSPQRNYGAIPVSRKSLPKSVRRGSLKQLSSEVRANVFVHTAPLGEEKIPVTGETSRRGNLVTAQVLLSELPQIAANPQVTYIELGQPLTRPRPITSLSFSGVTGTPAPDRFGFPPPKGDQQVLVGIIDVQGFDFAHPDFLDENGKTRFVRIWDQGGNVRPPPKDFAFGAELTQHHLNDAIRNAPKAGAPAQELERQSEMEAGSHGTHVASIAAGNRGVCPGAPIAAVLLSLGEEDFDRRKNFYDSTRLAQAFDYLLEVAKGMNLPISINISLGTNGHAHDGSSAVSRWVDSSLTVPGRCVCVAAGNAGQERGESPDDLGFIMGRIHTSGRLGAAGLDHDIEWVVVGNTIADVSENELELWFSPQDRITVSVKPPGMDWIGPVSPREFIENRELSDGSFLSVYNEVYHPANGCNYISIYLSPFLSDRDVVGVKSGSWIIRLHGREIRDGSFHGWIERDDPRPLGPSGPRQLWNFPSFFAERSNVDNSSISSLGCGHNLISVANYDSVTEKINSSSSQGPTRDGRLKPDIAAVGTNVVAAKGFAGPDDLWISMTGTSMASPVVTGVAALMLAREKRLTAVQIQGIMQRTARPLPGMDFEWSDSAAYGRIDAEACVLEAVSAYSRKDLTP